MKGGPSPGPDKRPDEGRKKSRVHRRREVSAAFVKVNFSMPVPEKRKRTSLKGSA